MAHAEAADPHRNYPLMAAAKDRVEPAPRRVRGVVDGAVVFDTDRALYVWEWPYYPQYYVPLDDVEERLLVDEGRELRLHLGTARRHGLRVGDVERSQAARVFADDADLGLKSHVRFEWDAMDAWFEEDEQIFVHPRNPYVRVDALRSHRSVRVELDGVVLAESTSPVLVFETGLPTRYYMDRSDVAFEHLEVSATRTRCPYKGITSDYWSVRTPSGLHEDLAWCYDFPTPAVQAITGMVAFYDEKVDVVVDEIPRPRPLTHFG
ncbi:MAG: DUF427 domain-containing protein [Marmoricola sp.]